MDGFVKRTEEKKRAIEEAALQILLEQGSKELRIESIAKRAGVSPVSIYNYYGGKKQLLFKVIKRYAHERYEYFERLLQKEHSFYEIIRLVILEKKAQSHVLTGDVLIELLEGNSDIKEYFEEFYQKYSLPLFLRIIAKGRKEGCIKEHLSDESILYYVTLFKAAIEKHIDSYSVHPNMDKLTEELTEMFFYGFLKEKRTP